LPAGGVSNQKVAAVTGYSLASMPELAKRYNTRRCMARAKDQHAQFGRPELLGVAAQAYNRFDPVAQCAHQMHIQLTCEVLPSPPSPPPL
jgi:hypothetical protein